MKKLLLLPIFLISTLVGQTWQIVPSGTTGDIWQFDFVNENVIWASASNGDILQSLNGGTSWTLKGNVGQEAYSIAGLSADVAVVVTGPNAGNGNIFRTTNGGTTWTNVYAGGAGAWFNFVDNLSATELWCQSDPVGANFLILKSNDAGLTWQPIANPVPSVASNVYGANNSFYRIGNKCWFGTGGATGATLANRIYYSANGPDGPWSFSTLTAQFTGSMAFSSANGMGVAGFWQAANTQNRSSDGGLSWIVSSVPVGLTRGLKYNEGQSQVWAATSLGLFESMNDGQSWTQVNLPAGVTGGINTVNVWKPTGKAVLGGVGGTLIVGTVEILPVELVSFTASHSGTNVELRWSTASEINNAGFQVERKVINANETSAWAAIGYKDGFGTTTEKKDYIFMDNISGINATSIAYRLKQLDFDGSFEYSEEVLVENIAPEFFSLNQNYPNPFNPRTWISFNLPVENHVSIKVFSALGEFVTELHNGILPAGGHSIEFDAKNLTSGTYYAVFSLGSGEIVKSIKMTLLK